MRAISQYTIKEQLLFGSGFFLMIALIMYNLLIPPFILLFSISCALHAKKPNYRKGSGLALFSVLLYLLYLISLAYSSNIGDGVFQLTTMLSYIIFPVLALFLSTKIDIALKGLKWGMIIGSACSMLVSLIRAVSIERGFSGPSFAANHYPYLVHASYLALIFLVACAFLWKEKSNSLWMKIVKWLYLALVIVSMFYLRSLGAFVCGLAILVVIPIWKALKTRKLYWLFILPIYGAMFFVGVKTSPRITRDIEASITQLSKWSESPTDFVAANTGNIESNTVRLVAWTLSGEMILQEPFGVGVGDANDALVARYEELGYKRYAELRLNPHNQYLHTGTSIGWLGIIVLCCMFIAMAIRAFKSNHLPLFLAVVCIAVSCLFESLLQRQVGVILTAIIGFYILLYPLSLHKENNTIE